MSGSAFRPLRKDQQRALRAYETAEAARRDGKFDDFEIAVQSFAATLLRSGLAVAASVLERSADRPGFELLLSDLQTLSLAGLNAKTPGDWPGAVRGLTDLGRYMQATRELVAYLAWLRRACQAIRV